jgi:hypothetical protein
MTGYELRHHLVDAHHIDLRGAAYSELVAVHTEDHRADIDVDHTHPTDAR